MLGKPVVKGTRLTVELILQKLADGYSGTELVSMYPGIEQADIDACLHYAAAMVASEEVIKAA
jgi:uncharacterized protein (DUF433 family)